MRVNRIESDEVAHVKCLALKHLYESATVRSETDKSQFPKWDGKQSHCVDRKVMTHSLNIEDE